MLQVVILVIISIKSTFYFSQETLCSRHCNLIHMRTFEAIAIKLKFQEKKCSFRNKQSKFLIYQSLHPP